MTIRSVALWGLCLAIWLAPATARAQRTPDKTSTQVGNDTCLTCHEDAAKVFSTSAHGRSPKGAVACEACHGSGSAHATDPQSSNILNPKKASAAQANEACLSCHAGTKGVQHWSGSRHAAADVRCATCHQGHAPWTADHALRAKTVNDTCTTCHAQVKKAMFQRSSHPLRNGQVQCTSCHNPHGSAGEKALVKTTINETCYSCHREKRGPFLFEHAPVRESCATCHVPHGSNNTMLLKTQTARLCQSCHLLGHHQTVAVKPGEVWTQNRACVNCHAQIHGSNHPSGAIFQR